MKEDWQQIMSDSRKKPPQVFISYAIEDSKMAERLCDDLKHAGVEPWLARNEILLGQNWKSKIDLAIHQSDYFCALLSSNSLSKTGYVQKELKKALDILDTYPASKPYLLPVRLDDCEPVEEKLSCIQRTDIFPYYNEGVRAILRVVAPDVDYKPEPALKYNDNNNSDREFEVQFGSSVHKFGSSVHKLCDREKQENDFLSIFRCEVNQYKKKTNCWERPQIYIVHGDEHEGHESFVERLKETRLQQYAESTRTRETAEVVLKDVTWPNYEDLKTRKRDLAINLGTVFQEENILIKSVSDFRGLRTIQEQTIYMIRHDIESSSWDKVNRNMIKWYASEFWNAGSKNTQLPFFLVFINIRYTPTPNNLFFKIKPNTKTSIKKQLAALCNSLPSKCLCKLIPELESITKQDVRSWLKQCKIYEDELLREKAIEEIFDILKEYENIDKNFFSMLNIQYALHKFIENYRIERKFKNEQ